MRRISQKQETNPARPMTTMTTATHIDHVSGDYPNSQPGWVNQTDSGMPRSRLARAQKRKPRARGEALSFRPRLAGEIASWAS